MHDGISLRQAWYNALNDAQTSFRLLLTSSSSPDWKRVPLPRDSTSLTSKGKGRSSLPELSDVVVHRRSAKSEDTVYRVVLDVPTADDTIPFDVWKSILATPELRQEWDPAVDGAVLLEMLDPTTRICKTNFTLGWPANPRDAVTISRTFNDATTIIDVSTSLPRSPDEPAYLRPSPPYVRSNVKLFAWCIQSLSPASSQPPTTGDSARKANSGRLRITCFWQHDLRAIWNVVTVSSLAQQLAAMVLGLLKTAIKRRSRVPLVTGYGNGVAVSRIRFDLNRESLTFEYSIIPEDEDHHSTHSSDNLQGLDELHAIREHRRLTRTVEFSIPLHEGWDVQISTQASSDKVAQLPWSARAYRNSAAAAASSSGNSITDPDSLLFRVNHVALLDDHSLLKVQVVVERSASSGLRLNGLPQVIEYIEERNPTSYIMSPQMLQDATSTADVSFITTSSNATGGSTLSGSSGSRALQLPRPAAGRSMAQEKSILSRIRRNYIYFSSLLQEPEAKWKRTTEARGVSVTQLDSIDPTLVVYKAEATFVGVGLWDLYAAIASPGARPYWDKQHEDSILLEDVNELTELWHFKSRPTWPANPRDAVLLKTVYKSLTTAHIFSFSADEPSLFSNIPPIEANTIRTQVDLQGFAIEALSPTTTLLTLLEQSDPKGWTNKTSIPQQMITTLAGIGDFAIKCGGPPVATRLAGARATEICYDHERMSFRIEYEVSAIRRPLLSPEITPSNSRLEDERSSPSSTPIVECELRCDMDTWAFSLDIVVDPPPQSASCLRRHRLSSGGGGLWLTLTHDAILAGDERLMAIVRRGPGRERGIVMLNGSKVTVDVEELPEAEIKSLSKQKRVKPPRVPLDQPPVLGAIRRRRRSYSGDGEEQSPDPPSPTIAEGSSENRNSTWSSAVPKLRSPLGRYLMQAMEQAATSTQQAVAAISPSSSGDNSAYSQDSEFPMEYALNALRYIQALHSQSDTTATTTSTGTSTASTQDGWTLISEKGFPLHRKVSPEISATLPVYKGERVIEGVSAEEIAAVVTSYDARKRWDERFVEAHVLEAFAGAGGAHTAFTVNKASFPFRDRGFYMASILARGAREGKEGNTTTNATATAINSSSDGRSLPLFCVSASFPPELARTFMTTKYNPYNLPIGQMFIDGWILETLDPYTTENYAIPSTRCTRVIAADYAGSLPAAVNAVTNTTLVKTLLSVEAYVKSIASLPFTRLPAAGVLLVNNNDDSNNKRVVDDDEKKDHESMSTNAWALKRRDESRVLVQTRWTPDDRVYRGILLLTVPAEFVPTASSFPVTPNVSSELDQNQNQNQTKVVVVPASGVVGDDGSSSGGVAPPSPLTSVVPVSSLESTTAGSSPSSTPPVRPHSRSVSSATVTPSTVRRRVTSAALVAGGRSPSSERSRRASSSAFTVRGEVRQATDFLVAEVVVDSKLYPEGYQVQLRSRPHDTNKPISLLYTTATAATATATTVLPATTDGKVAATAELEPTEVPFLPLTHTVHTLPSSPLHSSGLAVDQPPRHLLRLILPTAQTQISTLLDPLTGETRAPPPKPQWMVDLCEKGAVIEVEIRPAAQSVAVGSGKKTKGGDSIVTIDGVIVEVEGEKESLTSLGREELQDDRVAWMAVLSRHSSEAEGDKLPAELREARAVANILLEPSVESEEASVPKREEGEESIAVGDKEGNEETSSKPPQRPCTPKATTPMAGTNGGGLLRGLLNGYPSPLFSRFGTGSGLGSGATSEWQSEKAKSSAREGVTGHTAAGARLTSKEAERTGLGTKRFTLWGVIVIGLISFLIGSLLRSLISPADFIYVVRDVGEAGDLRSGWREVRRLVEVKYIVGGWDFQIAVVRRH